MNQWEASLSLRFFLSLLLAFSLLDQGIAAGERASSGVSTRAAAPAASESADWHIKVCLAQKFPAGRVNYLSPTQKYGRSLSEDAPATREEIDTKTLARFRQVGETRLRAKSASNCAGYDANLEKLKKSQKAVSECNDRISLELVAPTPAEIIKAQKEATQSGQPYQEPQPKCFRKKADGSKGSPAQDDPLCQQALKELKASVKTPARVEPKSTSVRAEKPKGTQQSFNDSFLITQRLEKYQSDKKGKCQELVDKENAENGLIRHLGSGEVTATSLANARLACAKEADDNRKSLSELKLNPHDRKSLALLSNPSLANEVLKDDPGACESYQRLRNELEKIAAAEGLVTAAIGGGAALGCALNPPLCGLIATGAGGLAALQLTGAASELERQAAAVRAAGGSDAEIRNLLAQSAAHRSGVAIEVAAALFPAVKLGKSAVTEVSALARGLAPAENRLMRSVASEALAPSLVDDLGRTASGQLKRDAPVSTIQNPDHIPLSSIKTVPETELSRVEKFVPDKTVNEEWFFKAEKDGKSVFVKTLDDAGDPASAEKMQNEIRMYQALDRLGTTPKFLGKTNVDGKEGLVVEWIDGSLVKPGKIPQDLVVRPSAIEDIREIARRVQAAGIEDASDLQFMISRDGSRAYLVDPAHFSFEAARNWRQQYNAIDEANELIRALAPQAR